jgi:hypothetical protein
MKNRQYNYESTALNSLVRQIKAPEEKQNLILLLLGCPEGTKVTYIG